jgi:hypothetical protein
MPVVLRMASLTALAETYFELELAGAVRRAA